MTRNRRREGSRPRRWARASRRARCSQPIEAFAWLGGNYFETRSDFPAKIGIPATEADAKLGAPSAKLTILGHGGQLEVRFHRGDVQSVVLGDRVVGDVIGPMPNEPGNEQWTGLSQMYFRYTYGGTALTECCIALGRSAMQSADAEARRYLDAKAVELPFRASCVDDEPAPADSPTLVIGSAEGDSDFSKLADGATPQLDYRSQGGEHFYDSLRLFGATPSQTLVVTFAPSDFEPTGQVAQRPAAQAQAQAPAMKAPAERSIAEAFDRDSAARLAIIDDVRAADLDRDLQALTSRPHQEERSARYRVGQVAFHRTVAIALAPRGRLLRISLANRNQSLSALRTGADGVPGGASAETIASSA